MFQKSDYPGMDDPLPEANLLDDEQEDEEKEFLTCLCGWEGYAYVGDPCPDCAEPLQPIPD